MIFYYMGEIWRNYRNEEACKLENVPKSGKSPKGGEGSAPEIKKSTIQNVDFLIRREGHIFIFFPNVNEHFKKKKKSKLTLK